MEGYHITGDGREVAPLQEQAAAQEGTAAFAMGPDGSPEDTMITAGPGYAENEQAFDTTVDAVAPQPDGPTPGETATEVKPLTAEQLERARAIAEMTDAPFSDQYAKYGLPESPTTEDLMPVLSELVADNHTALTALELLVGHKVDAAEMNRDYPGMVFVYIAPDAETKLSHLLSASRGRNSDA